MGCGASVQHHGPSGDKAAAPPSSGFSLFGARRGRARAEAAPTRVAQAPAAASVQPNPAASGRLSTPPARTSRPSGYEGLRIEAAPHATPVGGLRPEAGIAATPVGKLAEEYKFFCPLCMMFYRNIREVPCCKQHICAFCLADFLHTKQPSPQPLATGGELSPEGGGGGSSSAALAAADSDGEEEPPGGRIPKGVACPHCASTSEGKPLRLLDSKEDARPPVRQVAQGPEIRGQKRRGAARSYVDSPKTTAELARASSKDSPDAVQHSPLKVGDDFQTMARKMLPFVAPPPCDPEPDKLPSSCADHAGGAPMAASADAAEGA